MSPRRTMGRPLLQRCATDNGLSSRTRSPSAGGRRAHIVLLMHRQALVESDNDPASVQRWLIDTRRLAARRGAKAKRSADSRGPPTPNARHGDQGWHRGDRLRGWCSELGHFNVYVLALLTCDATRSITQQAGKSRHPPRRRTRVEPTLQRSHVPRHPPARTSRTMRCRSSQARGDRGRNFSCSGRVRTAVP